MAALGAQSIASSYEQLLHVDRDGGGNSTTHVSVKDGDNGTTFGFTIATDALMMSSTNRLEFGDTGTYINQSGDGVLNITSDTEVEINATTIDINGAADISGNLTVGGDTTITGNELVAFLPGVTQAVCQRINVEAGVTTALSDTVPALTPTLIGGNSGDVDNNMDDEYADPTALHTLDNATDDLAGFLQYF